MEVVVLRRGFLISTLAVILLLGLLLSAPVSPQATSLQEALEILEGVNRNLKEAKTRLETDLIPTISQFQPVPNFYHEKSLPVGEPVQVDFKEFQDFWEVATQGRSVGEIRFGNQIISRTISGVEFELARAGTISDEMQSTGLPPGLRLDSRGGFLSGRSSEVGEWLPLVRARDTEREATLAELWLRLWVIGTQPPEEQPPPGPGEVTLTVRAKNTVSQPVRAPIEYAVKDTTEALTRQGRGDTPFRLSVPQGGKVILRALNTNSLKFQRWEGAPAGANPVQMTVNADATVTAVYEELIPTGDKVTLTVRAWRVSEMSPPQQIAVPISGDPSSCSGTTPYQCQVNRGFNVTLTASSSIVIGGIPHGFTQWWEGDPPSWVPRLPVTTITVKMDKNRTMAAAYAPGGEGSSSLGIGGAGMVAFQQLAAAARPPMPQDALLMVQEISVLLGQALDGLDQVLGRSELPEAAWEPLSASRDATEQARESLRALQDLLQAQIEEHGGETVGLEAQRQALSLAEQVRDLLTTAIREKETGESTMRESLEIATEIAGFKFEDLNGNGQRDAGETGIQGWEINLTGPEGEKRGRTDAQGHFEFTARTPGTYMISEEFRQDWVSTTGGRSILLRLFPPEGVPEILFGNRRQKGLPPSLLCPSGLSLDEAARVLLATLRITPNAQVFVLNRLLPPDTVVSSAAPPEVEVVREPVDEESFFFFLDDEPSARFGHPMRYAIVSCSGDIRILSALWWPQIELAGVGTRVLSALGEGILASFPFTLVQDGPVVSNPIDQKPTAPSPEQPAPQNPCQEEPPKKYALVLDAGDKDKGGISVKLKWPLLDIEFDDIADNMAADADGMERVLEKKSYDVDRYSNYWGNRKESATKAKLQAMIGVYAQKLRPCDELFIFISAHGWNDGFSLYDSSGNGGHEWITFRHELGQWLTRLPNGVKVTVMIDSCRSGGAIRHLRGANRTIITSTDAKTETPDGQGWTDSFTDDFLEAFDDVDGADRDGDGEVSWREAYEYAKEQGEEYNPQYHEGP